MYANVDRKILSDDFTKLGPEVMLSSFAFSFAEDVLGNKKMKKTKIEISTTKEFMIDKKNLKKIILQILSKIGKMFDKITITFLNDKELLELNQKFLQHDTLTDILTFTYNKTEPISTEILISFERAFENSKKYKEKFEDEILRLIAHGLLHSIGYEDKTKSQKLKMRKAENDLLNSIDKSEFIKKFVIGSEK